MPFFELTCLNKEGGLSVALPGTARRAGILHDVVGQINYAACQTEGETLLYHGDAEREREVLGNTWATAQ